MTWLCFFWHTFRHSRFSPLYDVCIRCGDTRPHRDGTKEE